MKNQLDLATVFESLPDPHLVLSKDFGILTANIAYLAATRTTLAEIKGQNIFEVFQDYPEIPEANSLKNLEASLLEVLRTKTTHEMPVQRYTGPKRNIDKELERIYWKPINTPVLNAKGNVDFIIHKLSDVTDHVRTNKKNQESEAQFKNVLLQSPNIFVILKGFPEMIITFANEPLFKSWGRTAEIIGKPFLEALPELKEQSFPKLLQRVFETGETYYQSEEKTVLMKNGVQVDTYYTYVYQAIFDDHQKVTGVTIMATDITQQVTARKKIEASEKRFSNLLMKSPFAVAILKGPDMVVALANDAIKHLWGKGNKIESKSLFSLMPEIKDQGFGALLEKVYTTGEPFYGHEVLVELKRNGIWEEVYFNFIYQPYKEADESISGVTIIANEVTTHAIANKRIAASEKNVRSLFMQAPAIIIVHRGPQHVYELSSEVHQQLIGNRALVGKPVREAMPELEGTGIYELLDHVYATGEPFTGNELVVKVNTGAGKLEEMYFNFVYQPLYNSEGEINGIFVHGVDVTEQVLSRKKIEESEERQAYLLKLSDALKELLDPKEIQLTACRILGEHVKANRVLYAEVVDEEVLVVNNNYANGVPPLIARLNVEQFGKNVIDAFKRNEKVIISDINTDSGYTEDAKQRFLSLNMVANVGIGLVKGGGLVATFGVHQNAPRDWTEIEISLMEETAERTWAAVERAKAEEALRQSEEKYRWLFQTMEAAFVVCDPIYDESGKMINYRFLQANSASTRLIGREEDELLGKTVLDIVPNVEDWWLRTYEKVVKTRETVRVENYVSELNAWFDVTVFYYGNGQFAHYYDNITNRKLAEAAIVESEVAFRSFVTASSDIVFKMSGDWKQMQFLNGKEFLVNTEGSTESWTDTYIPRHEKQRLTEAIEKAISGKEVFELEHEVFDSDGNLALISSRAVPVLNDEGDIIEWMGAATDITRRKQAEEKYRTIFETIDEGFCIQEVLTDEAENVRDVIYREVNDAYTKHSGIKNAVGKKGSELFPHLEQYWLDAMTHVYKTGEPVRTEGHQADVNRWYTLQYSRVGGPGSRFISVVFNDITEQKERVQQQAFLLKFSDALRAETNVDAVANLALQMLSDYLRLDRCYVGVYQLVDDRGEFPYQIGNDRVPPVPDSVRLSDFPDAMRVAFDRTLVIDDVAKAEGLTETDRTNLGLLGLCAFVAASLRSGKGNPLWSIVAVSASPRHWASSEIELMEEATERTWTAIERAKSEEALRKSEEQFRKAIENAPIPVIMHAEDGEVLQISHTWTKLTGFTPDEVPTFDMWLTQAYGDGANAVRNHMHDLFNGKKQILNIDFPIRTRNGAKREWSFSASSPGVLSDGRRFIVGMAVDITERKNAEEQLKNFNTRLEQEVKERTLELNESYQTIQSVLDTTLLSISVLKAVRNEHGDIVDFKIQLVNKQLIVETGRNDLIGKLYTEEYPGVKKVGVFDAMLEVMNSGEPKGLEYFYSHKGLNNWFSGVFVKLDDGLVATNLDITPRKQAEDERFRNYVLLQQSEELAESGSWDLDLVSGAFGWSDGMYRLFDLKRDTEVQPEIYLEYATPDSMAAAKRVVAHLRAGDKEFEETLEISVGGKIKVVHLKATVVKNNNGVPVRVLGVDLDISAMREAERKLRQMEVRQQQEIFHVILNTQEEERRRISESLHNGLGQLLYGTKLSMNYLTVKMATEQPEKFNESKKYVEKLLTDSIKDTRRISHELMPTVLAEFGLKAAIKDICEQLQDGTRISCHVSLNDVKLEDYVELAVFRTVQELVVNIVKHAEATRAKVEVRSDAKEILISVSDNGRGISLDNNKKPGIGLFSIRNKAELLKGSLDIQSAPGKGTKVEVRIPIELIER